MPITDSEQSLESRFVVDSLNEREKVACAKLASVVRRMTRLSSGGDLEVKADIGPHHHIEVLENQKTNYYEVRIRADIAVRTPDGLVSATERVRFTSFLGSLKIEMVAEGHGRTYCLPEYTVGGFFDKPLMSEGEGKFDSLEMLDKKLEELIGDPSE